MPDPDTVKHKYIDLIEFALATRSFSVQQILDATKMSGDEFNAAKHALFHLKGMHENPLRDEVIDWTLKPEAYFQYLSYLEFKHSVESSKRAYWVAWISMSIAAISVVIACISLVL